MAAVMSMIGVQRLELGAVSRGQTRATGGVVPAEDMTSGPSDGFDGLIVQVFPAPLTIVVPVVTPVPVSVWPAAIVPVTPVTDRVVPLIVPVKLAVVPGAAVSVIGLYATRAGEMLFAPNVLLYVVKACSP